VKVKMKGEWKMVKLVAGDTGPLTLGRKSRGLRKLRRRHLR
jgi:hypothetical protein